MVNFVHVKGYGTGLLLYLPVYMADPLAAHSNA